MAVRKIETELALTGEKEFNAQMTAVNSNLKTLRSDMSAVSAEFDGNADSVEALTAKQRILQDSVDQQRVKVDALRAMHAKAAEAYGENSAQADKYKQQLNGATVALAKEKAALEKNATALEAAKKSQNTYIPITQRMANATKGAGDKVKDMASKISQGAHHVPVLGEALDVAKVAAKGLDRAADGAKVAVKGLGSAASASVKGLGNAASGMGKMAAGAAKATAGVLAAGAALGVAAIASMAAFAKESAEAAKAASEAGETLTESQQAWLDYSDKLDSLEESVFNAKSALGGMLLPMLSDLSTDGANLLSSFSKRMEEAGGDTEKQAQVISDTLIAGATLIKSRMPEYIEAGKTLILGLGEGLVELAPDLLEIAIDLCVELLNGIIEYAPELAEAAMALVGQLGEGLAAHGPDLLISAVGMVSEIIRGLAQAAPDLVPAAVQLVGQLVVALIAAAPELLLAGLELVYGIIQGIFNSFDDIENAVGQIIETAKTAFGDKADEFMKIGSDIIALLKEGISDAWDGLVSWFTDLWDSLFGDRTVDVTVNGDGNGSTTADGSHASGLDYVPFDGYLAKLHRGETVLTAAEAALYRRNKLGMNDVKKIVNLYFTAKEITEADINMVVEIVNRKLGEAM